jgi:hypothetical protein
MTTLRDTPWTQLDKLIEEYVDGYEMCDCEDANGNTGDYCPTEMERGMILDAIQGLIGDKEIINKLLEAHEFTRAYRRANGECEDCGRVLPEHWGACSAEGKSESRS